MGRRRTKPRFLLNEIPREVHYDAFPLFSAILIYIFLANFKRMNSLRLRVICRKLILIKTILNVCSSNVLVQFLSELTTAEFSKYNKHVQK